VQFIKPLEGTKKSANIISKNRSPGNEKLID